MLNRCKPAGSQRGFTLIEMAIVLVIIGLLIGGILKGQSMILNARVKALAQDFKAVITAMNAYQDRFRALPGDDPAVGGGGTHLPTATLSTATPGNGGIDTVTWVGAAVPAAGDESSLFWEHVRLSGFASGSATSGQGTNAMGGRLGITTNLLRVNTPAGVEGTIIVCASGISGNIARQLDATVDDGDATTGSMFAADEAGGGPIIVATPAAAYVDTSIYTVCQAF